jgi:Tol biopolymer transport system component
MNVDGSDHRTVFSDAKRNPVAPTLSPGGDRIAFGFGTFFRGPRGAAGLAIIGTDGRGFQQVELEDGNHGFPSWSPDGRRLVYRSATANGKGLSIIDLASGAITKLTSGPFNDNFPSWSPRGDLIAFTTDRDGDWEIYVIRQDGTGLKRLTNSPGNDAHCSWSPDGEWIAFSSGRQGFKDEAALYPQNGQPYGEIHVMRADGSEVVALTDDPFEDATPAFAPNPDSPNRRVGHARH